MKQIITLDDNDIRTALVQFVGNEGVSLKDKDTTLTITAGRKGRGYSAEIAINDRDGTVPNKPDPIKETEEDSEEDNEAEDTSETEDATEAEAGETETKKSLFDT